LQFNTSKTELLWCATACTSLRVGTHLVNPASTVRDLGIYIDVDLSGRTQILKTTASCFAALRQLQTVRRYLPLAAYISLIVSLVSAGQRQRNAVRNAAARLIFNVTSALMELHWLSAVD